MFFSFFDKIPIIGVKIVIALIMAIIAIWIWTLPNKYIFRGIAKPKIWHNLKLWVAVLLGVQIIIYLSL